MNYAIVRINGKQYKVKPGQEFLVDKVVGEKPECEVLLVVNEDKVTVGEPVIVKNSLKLKVLEPMEKGKKITVQTYKAKSRSRRKIGFRPQYTRLLVESI